MTTKAPEPVVEVGDGLSARWNTHVSNIASHLSITDDNDGGRLIGRVFDDTQAGAWEKLPDAVGKIVAERKAAAAAMTKAVEEDAADISKAKDEAIKRILARRNGGGSTTTTTTASIPAPATKDGDA